MPTQSWAQVLISAQSDGTTLTAAATASCLPAQAKYTLPANFFSYIGQQLQVKAYGRISSVITTPGTAQFDVRFASTSVFAGGAVLLDTVAGHTNVGWSLDIIMTARAVGSTANLFGVGTWTCEDILGVPASAPKGVLSAILPWNTAPAVGSNFDGTTSQVVDINFTQTVATGSLTLHGYSLIALN